MIVTQTEVEAFHLEQNLIKRHRPTFNVRLRDDKSYPYIAVTVEDEYPRVMFTRERHRRGVVYFGPYASAKKVRETLDVLNRVSLPAVRGPAAGAPLGDPVPRLPHRPLPGSVRRLRVQGGLPGDHRSRDRVPDGRDAARAQELEEKMQAAAERQDFEEAALPQPAPLGAPPGRAAGSRQAGNRHGRRHRPGRERRDGGRAGLPLRDGRLVDRHTFYLDNEASEDVPQLLESFCLEYYGSAPAIPPLIVVPPEAGATERSPSTSRSGAARASRCAPHVAGRRGVSSTSPSRTPSSRSSDSAHRERKRLRRIEALEERECVNLESLPLRIECFDISNIQGESPVGSMVVFQDAVPKKAHYRKFGIKGVEGQDDFAMMNEVISRRFARAKEVTADRYDEGFAAIPNLVVIDGGKGQLSAALAAMKAHDLPRVAVIALAKREEEVFVPGRSEPVVLCATRPASSSSSGSATRLTASRSAFTEAPRREGAGVDPRRAPGRRRGCAHPAFRLARAAARLAKARGRPRRACEDRPADLRGTGRASLTASLGS